MSEYHDSTYQAHDAPGRMGSGGVYAGGYAGGYEDDDPVYGDDGPAYGDDGPAYGDEGPAYGDEGPAYGDAGPAEYSEDVANSDYGPAEYSEDVASPYPDEQAYAAHGEEAAAPAPRRRRGKRKKGAKGKKRGKSKKAAAAGPAPQLKPLIAAAVGLALLGAMGAAGYFLLSGSEGKAGFDLTSLTRLLPVSGAQETEETLAAGQANAVAVRKAMENYVAAHGKPPGSPADIQAELSRLGWVLRNPYKPSEPPAIAPGEAPGAPGALAFVSAGGTFEVRVGGSNGAPLAIGGVPYVATGVVASVPRTSPPPRPSPAVAVASPGPETVRTPAPGGSGTTPGTPPPDKDPEDGTPAPGEPPSAFNTPWPEGAPSARPTSPPKPLTPAQARERNRAFDRWRNQGIGLVYEQRTTEAVAAFQKALALRPDDPVVTHWLTTIQGAIDVHAEDTRRQYEGAKQNLRMKAPPEPPAIPPTPKKVAVDDAKRLLRQMKDPGAGQVSEPTAPRLAAPRMDE